MDGSHAQWQFSGAYAANALGFAAIRNHECTEQHSSRRDHRAVFFASRAARRPCPLSTTPTPLRKPRDRHKRHSHSAAEAAGFRLRLGGGVALRLRSRRLSVCAPLFPLADRRPKPDDYFLRAIRRASTCRTRTVRARLTSRANSDSGGSAVRYSRTSSLLCNPSRA